MTKVNGLIEKWGLQLAVRNGQEGFTVTKGRADVATVAEMRELKPEILAELHRREDEFLAATRAKAAAVKAAHEEKIRAIKTGEKNIELRWHDGEYLSGWEALSEAGELLEELGLARYVEGWGYHVKADVEEALGETFTYAEAIGLARPALEAEAAKKAAAEAARQANDDARQAKRATMKVEILKKGSFGAGEGSEAFAEVNITDVKTGESAQFACRNIFDFGYVINPLYAITPGGEPGGIANEGYWEESGDGGWHKVRPLTSFEKQALDYLREFSPIYTGIRM